MSLKTVSDAHVDDLFTHGATLIRNALRSVDTPDEEQAAVAAIAARFFDRRAVCRIVGPGRQFECPFPRHQDGLIGITLISASSCGLCNQTVDASELPASTVAIFEAMDAASESLGPGDVVVFRGGPVLPPSTIYSASRVWWHAPAYDDLYSVYVDPHWGSRLGEGRDPTTKSAVQQRTADAPFACEFPRVGIDPRTGRVAQPAECVQRPKSSVW